MTDQSSDQTDQDAQMLAAWLPKEARIHGISKQDYIITTEDRLHRRIHEHAQAINGNRAWLIPFSILLTVLISLVTTEFKEFIFSAEFWQAFFMIVLIGSSAILLWQLIKRAQSPTIDDLVEKIKETAQGDSVKE